MASIVAQSCRSSSSSHVSPVMTVQEKGNRNKRKFRADSPPSTGSQLSQHECLSYEFSAEKFESHGHSNGCNMCSFNHENTNSVKLDLGLSYAVGGVGSREVGMGTNDVFHDVDWSDLTESQLEELVLANLDTMFKTAIKKIVSFGYTEEVASKAVLRSGLCCGCKDTVSNIVENSLIFLKNGQEVNASIGHHFENLQQMEKYTLAELVCVLREVRPFFSTGDAMWCLLISDMNVSQACAMDGEVSEASNGYFSNSVETQLKKEVKSSESVTNPCKPNHSSICAQAPAMTSIPCVSNSMSEPPSMAEVSQLKPNAPFVLDVSASQKRNQTSNSSTMSRSFSLPSQNHEQKPAESRKLTSFNKRDYILRQKSAHFEKNHRTHGLKGISRAGKLGNNGGSILDKKLKSVSVADTETDLSLSLPVKSNNLSFSAMPYSKPFDKWTPQDRKDEMVSKLVPSVRELENQLQEWTEWANQKVMQAARRLGKDRTELKTLKQEKEEVERLKKEKQALEENTMKKLSEMENALCKASGQVGRANSAVCRLEVENANLRVEMEAANLQAVESAASCEEVLKREKTTLFQLQLWEKHKTLFQEELVAERRKLARLQQDLELAKQQRDQLEVKWKQEEKAKEELVPQAIKFRIGRQEGEVSAKSREDLTRLKADKNLKKYKDDIEKLEKEISLLRLKSDSSKIAALKRGIDGSYSSKLTDIKTSYSPQEPQGPYISVKRERECVMCLSEEMSVVFLPCAHQIVCKKCNELHEKQGMKDCPSCRGPIERRICVRYARS